MNDPDRTGPHQPETSDEVAADLPQRIGRYRIEKILGEGGFGRVYLAHDEQLQRPVAVKVPHRRLVSRPEDAEAYRAEARTVAGLDHPNIVPVYDVGGDEDHPCFVVSKYIDGSTLAQRIQANRPSVAETSDLTATVAETLHYAHKQGLVHRDIKPGNILLDTSGKPFVADFGLALRERDIGRGPRYVGTPAYMSPEQARGEGHRVDGRSDIFSLGVVLYELLTGRRPFQADSQADLLEQITNMEVRPPRQWEDTIPKELERICLKALSKRASERYTTAKDMGDDLRQFLNAPQPEAPKGLPSALLADTGNLLRQMGLSGQRAKVARSTFLFADFKGFTERVRILENAAGHQAAAEMKRQVAHYVVEAFRRLAGEIEPADYALIDTAGDGFFFHFRLAKDAFRFAESLHRLATAHNAQVTDEIAEHRFRTGAATGDVAWDEGKPVGHVVNVGSRLQSASTGGDLVIDQATYDDLPSAMQQQFGPKESIRDKHDKTYDVYRTAFGRALPPLPISNPIASTTPVPSPVPTPASDSRPLKIVPRGLRSFVAQDADFFLDLLPGPRDRDGLPDSIGFWKTRIEETDADDAFTVGLIYGPSGCGKSSLVKAGLLPRLSDKVIAVYVEATGEETETRLLNGLRKRCPALPDSLGLKETLASLRRGQGVPVGKKVLLVLDQFEQWLHARRNQEKTELVQALRQCDGGRVQCIVMVRDDFWMAVTRFLSGLEIELLQGRNCAAADLFDLDHARKVLTAFGCAFGKLPEKPAEISKEQKEFLTQAVSGLSQEDKVISVRLALFAEMVKSKPWTPATLKEVGGTEGVGVTFLDDAFSSPTANPKHRLHQKAARAVLKALLPESGTDIKGHLRSHAELLQASGYANRPKDFDDLLRILDGEIRLITPTDPEGKEGAEESTPHVQAGQRYYQLTHDYLVPSLRDWLTRKQKETRRGRAELLLADRAAVWNARPENRHLPAWWEWANIHLFTRKMDWTHSQRRMMQKATQFYLVAGLLFVVFVVAVVLSGWGGSLALALTFTTASSLLILGFWLWKRRQEERHVATLAAALVDRLMDAEIAQVPVIITEMQDYRQWTDPLLKIAYAEAEDHKDAARQLHASLALLAVDTGQVDYLYGRLLDAEPQELAILRDALSGHRGMLIGRLWPVVERHERGRENQRLRAAGALAAYDPDNARWDQAGGPVAEQLVSVNPVFLGRWMDALRPVKARLVGPLTVIFRNRKEERTAERTLATNILADYAADQPQVLADLVMDADERQFAVVFPKFKEQGERGLPILSGEIDLTLPLDAKDEAKENLAKRQANAAAALLKMNQLVWPLLQHGPDPRVRSYLIHRLAPLGADAGAILKRLDEEPDVTIRRALLLSLGEYDEKGLSPEARQAVSPKLQETYSNDADPGLHGACEWLLRKWGQEAWLKQVNDKWAKDRGGRQKRLDDIKQLLTQDKETPSPQWYVNGQGQTMVVIPGPVEFLMGSPTTETGRSDVETQHRVRIGRTFALAAKPVTLGQFQTYYRAVFKEDYDSEERYTPTDSCPVNYASWFQAAAYCNWLSKQEGLPECYETDARGQATKLKENYLSLTGYRLPTEAEMEFATRAGAVTARYYGESEELLPKYAWYLTNSQEKTWPVGKLKPNDLGLFDVQGNVYTWCQEGYRDYGKGDGIEDDKEDVLTIDTAKSRVLRGGSFYVPASDVRSAYRLRFAPSSRYVSVGFRPARTFIP